MMGGGDKPATVAAEKPTFMKAVGQAAGDAVTVSIAGGLFGAAASKGWLSQGGVAVDGAIGALGLLAGAAAEAYGLPGFARQARNVGLTGLAVFAYRKGEEITGGASTKKQAAMSGEVVTPRPGKDRIEQVAAQLDL